MTERNALTQATTRLRTLLAGATSGLRDDILAVARSLDPRVAGDVVGSVIDAEWTHPTADGSAIRAVHLARELRLAGAVPSVVRCIERHPLDHPLRRAALAALTRLGPDALDELLAAFDRSATAEGRAQIAEALALTTVDDDRVRAAFVRMLQDDPVNGARCLEEHGDWRSVADLARAADRILVTPPDDCPVCAEEQLRAVASSLRALGGRMSDEQDRGFAEVMEHAEASWISLDDRLALPGALPVPARRGRRPGRNDPCPCGSGKKYKTCHLGAGAQGAGHWRH